MLQDAGQPVNGRRIEMFAEAEPEGAVTVPPVLPIHDGQRPRPTGPLLPLRRPDDVTSPRATLIALPGLVTLAVVTAFFCWVTAEPFWIAVGHSVDGTVTVNRCAQTRCEGDFRPAAGGDTLPDVRITGDPDAQHPGVTVAARASSDHAGSVYAGDDAGAWWRAGAGVTAIVACGVGIAAVTGAWRWRGAARGAVTATAVGAPLLLFTATTALAW